MSVVAQRDPFGAFLPTLLDRPLRPPSMRVDARGGRRTRVEIGDFAGHTPYLPGDDLRFLDWKALARSRQKLLRTFDEVRHRRLALVVDASSSLECRWDGLVWLTRMWSFLALHRLDSFELILLHGDRASRRVYDGPESWGALDESLCELKPEGSRGLGLMHTLSDFGRADQDLVVVSDFQPESVLDEVMHRAAHDGRRLLLVFPRLAFEAEVHGLPSGRVFFDDVESRDSIEVEMGSQLHEAFLEEQRLWEGRVRARSAQLGHAFMAATLPGDLERAVEIEHWLPFLEEAR